MSFDRIHQAIFGMAKQAVPADAAGNAPIVPGAAVAPGGPGETPLQLLQALWAALAAVPGPTPDMPPAPAALVSAAGRLLQHQFAVDDVLYTADVLLQPQPVTPGGDGAHGAAGGPGNPAPARRAAAAQLAGLLEACQALVINEGAGASLAAMMIHPQAAADVAALIAVPLSAADGAIAVLCLCSRRARIWSAVEIELAQCCAKLLHQAVENANALATAAKERVKLVAIFDQMDEGLAICDASGMVTWINQHGARLLGGALQVAGRRRQEIWPELTDIQMAALHRRGMQDELTDAVDYLHVVPDGERAWLRMRCRLLSSGEEVIFFKDVTQSIAAQAALRRADARLRDSHDYLRLLIDSTAEGLYAVDRAGNTTLCNAALLHMLGFSRMSDIVGRRLHDLIHHSHPDGSPYAAHDCPIYKSASTGSVAHVTDEVFFRRDGSRFPVEYWVQPIWKNKTLQGALCTFTDITERRKAEQRLQSLFEHHTDAITTCELDGRFLSSNAMMREMTGYGGAELGALYVGALAPEDEREHLQRHFRQAVGGTPQKGRLRLRRSDAGLLDVEMSFIPIMVEDEVIGIYTVVRDISAEVRHERHIEHLASHDVLTGLPNRRLVDDRLRHALQHRKAHALAVLFLDLNRFKLINDSLGHDKGDLLLKTVASRMKATLRASDTIARMGGDEFVVILERIDSVEQVAATARKLLQAVEQPIRLADHDVSVSTSIGISVYPRDGNDAQTLLKHADIAMYRAKEVGAGTFRFYDADMNTRALERLLNESGLRHAVERNELVVHYQPRVDIARGVATGVEALVRWQDPQRGLIAPVEFIPLAEEIGLITAVGEWVLTCACKQNFDWQHAGLPPVRVSVNLSGHQLTSPGFTGVLRRTLHATGLAPCWLELEITESSLMENLDASIATLREIRAMGVSMSIDDFGTGYSSLSRLKKLPVDTLKIDQSFINHVTDEGDDAMIVSAIIALAHNMGLDVVAEGVTQVAQARFLTQKQCTTMQGYLFSRPITAGEVPAFLRRSHRLPN